MADEFIFKAQAVWVQDIVAVDHDRVIERPAARQTHFAKGFDFMQETESARIRDFTAVRSFFQLVQVFLAADNGACEFDLKTEELPVGRDRPDRPPEGPG